MDLPDQDYTYSKKERRYKRISFITICSLYLLILAGGIVRSTGSGMGCPDWPKCFNQWVPPTSLSELPSNYKEIYSAKREAKNEKFSKYLDFFGFTDLAEKIRTDKTILHEADFNVANTWTEYINRLIGAITGFLIILMVVFSLPLRKKNPALFLLSSLILVLVIFQGWMGSIVVSTNLTSWIITVHMLIALVILALVIYAYLLAKYLRHTWIYMAGRAVKPTAPLRISKGVKQILWICILITLFQILLGTQVREMIDEIADKMNFSNRENWVEKVGNDFIVHRTFSWAIAVFHILLFYSVSKNFRRYSQLYTTVSFMIVILLLQIVSGVILAYAALPQSVQPIHLTLSSLLFGAQIAALFYARRYVVDY